MSKSNVKIISNGDASSTQILVDGIPIKHVSELSIPSVLPGEIVKAHITILSPALEINNVFLNVEPISEENAEIVARKMWKDFEKLDENDQNRCIEHVKEWSKAFNSIYFENN